MSNEDIFHLAVKAIIFNDEGHILLLQFSEKKVKTMPWDLPGGRVQKGEAPEEALRREVFEETGLQNIEQAIPYMMILGKVRIRRGEVDAGLIKSSYLCEVADISSIQLSEEHHAFGWFSPEKAAHLLVDYPEEFTQKLAGIGAKYQEESKVKLT